MKRASSFVDKEKQVLMAVAEQIGSTLGQVAALGKVAKKASRFIGNKNLETAMIYLGVTDVRRGVCWARWSS